jgi:hypothetical protein
VVSPPSSPLQLPFHMLGVRPRPIRHTALSPPRVALIVTGLLSAVPTSGAKALIMEARAQAVAARLLTSEVYVDPGGHTAHFTVFVLASVASMDAKPWCHDLKQFEDQLYRIRGHHAAQCLEWAVVVYGQGNQQPEFARGSYTHVGGPHP